MHAPTIRIARPTVHLKEIVAMYVQGLHMEELGGFENHAGYDGVMVGQPGQTYHLEFTYEHGAVAESAPSAEHMLVFYLPEDERRATTCESMLEAGFVEVSARNPYWTREGRSFRDLDGYLVVICRQEWDR